MSQKDEFQIDITPSTFHSVRNTHFYKSSIFEIDSHLNWVSKREFDCAKKHF